MSHELDTSNNRNNMAYVGEKPWHGLGQALTLGADIDTWRREAGLEFQVLRSPVQYHRDGILHEYADRHVLFRDDTGAPLSVMSNDYKIVQPGEILGFIAKVVEAGGYTMETAGSLMGGRKVWALAKVHDGADIIGHDRVRPYLLACTSFDGKLATTVKFSAIRVVCDNTITMATGGRMDASGSTGQTEKDITEGPVVQCVRVSHDARFDPDAVRQQLGIVIQAWERFVVNARILAHKELSPEQADDLTYDLIAPTITARPGMPLPDVRKSRGYGRIMELFSGQAIGADLVERPSAWAWLNACTQFVDHERGRTRDTGLDSAWFGQGDRLKTRAMELALAA